MSLIGIDFGSHCASLALCNDDGSSVEVFADDMGSRSIPCVVAFRGEEILVGHAALVQQHKNRANTFPKIRELLDRADGEGVEVPLLEKSLSVVELVSHFFRHVHNQVKQQVGKAVRDCVITVPHNASDNFKARLSESAKAGGIRIKAFIPENIAAALGQKIESPPASGCCVMVVDLGWSKSEISCFLVLSEGALIPIASKVSTEVTGQSVVSSLTAHCAKDFQRKAKFPCVDNARAMVRLGRECEAAVKVLSTTAETTIGIDSLCEGVDYTGKVSRARFDDLCGTYFMGVRGIVREALQGDDIEWTLDRVSHIVLAGGFSALPRAQSILSSEMPNASFVRGRVEPAETLCVGACTHGAVLIQEGCLESPPTEKLSLPCSSTDIYISGANDSSILVVPAGALLPYSTTVNATAAEGPSSSLFIHTTPSKEDPIGRMVFDVPSGDAPSELSIDVSMTLEGSLRVIVRKGNVHLEKIDILATSE